MLALMVREIMPGRGFLSMAQTCPGSHKSLTYRRLSMSLQGLASISPARDLQAPDILSLERTSQHDE